MPSPSLDLNKKSELLLEKWQACKNSPDFDVFVEFAVGVSSMTEFLEVKGLSGLHQIAHGLEQKVLSLFDQGGEEALSPQRLLELNVQITGFHARVQSYIEGSTTSVADRRK